MYDELIRSCRACATGYVGNCDNCMFSGKDCYKQLHKASADAIEELSKPKWIPVTERLPEQGKQVLVTGIEAIGNVRIYGVKQLDGDVWRPTSAPSCYWEHWMPLPEPPKEEET